jgi:hypothetical protein
VKVLFSTPKIRAFVWTVCDARVMEAGRATAP